MAVADLRLRAQQIARHDFTTPAGVVGWMGAIQAQDYLASLWAVGLRLPDATAATVEASIADGSIVRLHALRGTWQYVARDDVRWLLGVVGARVIAGAAGRHRQLGLDPTTLERATAVVGAAVRGGRHATRAELGAALAAAGIAPDGQRLIHILAVAELAGVLGSGARRGKQVTFAALAERCPAAAELDRTAAIAELARRFVRGRAPATAPDFAWWSGLPLAAARAGLAAAQADAPPVARVRAQRSPTAYLLPAFDEYLVGYTDRSAVLDPAVAVRVNAGGGMLNPVIVVDGRVVGTWRRDLGKHAVVVTLEPFAALAAATRAAIDRAADRYAAFLASPVRIATSARWQARRRPRPRPRRRA